METVIESRAANALFSNAQVSTAFFRQQADVARMSGQWLWARILPKTITRQMSSMRVRQGGLWVGGRAVLTTTSLKFQPNQMNADLHEKPESLKLEVPLLEIIDLGLRHGSITDIIDVRYETGNLSIRCFRADSFRSKIWQQVELSRNDREAE